ncbi:MAG: hypothetical protein AABW92_01310 [Nanoarchaeota archaeon]
MIKWLFKKIAGKIFLSIILLVLAGGVLFFLGKNLNQASLKNFNLDNIQDITTDSFTITGNLLVNNPSKLSIPVKSVDFDIILKESKELLTSGHISSFNLEIGESNIPIEQEVNWVPTAQLALELITKEHVYALVVGKIKINLPGLEKYEIPFNKEVDIKDYVKQFASEQIPIDSKLPDDTPGNIILPINEPLI